MYLRFQGGDIVSLTHDKAVVLKRLNNNAPALNSNYQLQTGNTDTPQTLFDRQVTQAGETLPLNTHQRVSVVNSLGKSGGGFRPVRTRARSAYARLLQ